MKESSVNEFTPFLCGAQVDLTMYSTTAYHVTGEDEIAMTPEYPVEEATYAVYPALPEGVTLNEATGAIAGATAHFRHFSSYTAPWPARRPSSSSPWRRVSIRRSPHR